MSKTTPKKLSLTQQLALLDEQVAWFFSEDFDLEIALERYKTALALSKSIDGELQTLKNQITKIEEDFSK